MLIIAFSLKTASLISADSLAPAKFILQENITALYADYRNKSAPEAVVSMQFTLYQCKNGVTAQIATISLSEKTPIAANNPASLLEGYQHNLSHITQSLGGFIDKHLD